MTNKMPEHMFIAYNGDLLDTRRQDWASRPLREKFEWHHPHIEKASQLVACIRAGEYAWPGGYRLAFVTSDGITLSFKAVKDNLRLVVDSIRHKNNDGWRVVALISVDNYGPVYCDHTGEKLGGHDEEQEDE